MKNLSPAVLEALRDYNLMLAALGSTDVREIDEALVESACDFAEQHGSLDDYENGDALVIAYLNQQSWLLGEFGLPNAPLDSDEFPEPGHQMEISEVIHV